MTKWRESLLTQAPYQAYNGGGTGFQNPEVIFDSEGLVTIQGLVNWTTTPTVGSIIAKLPNQASSGYTPVANPEKTLLFDCYTLGGTVRVDINSNGEITLAHGTVNSWISLSGIKYISENVPSPAGGRTPTNNELYYNESPSKVFQVYTSNNISSKSADTLEYGRLFEITSVGRTYVGITYPASSPVVMRTGYLKIGDVSTSSRLAFGPERGIAKDLSYEVSPGFSGYPFLASQLNMYLYDAAGVKTAGTVPSGKRAFVSGDSKLTNSNKKLIPIVGYIRADGIPVKYTGFIETNLTSVTKVTELNLLKYSDYTVTSNDGRHYYNSASEDIEFYPDAARTLTAYSTKISPKTVFRIIAKYTKADGTDSSYQVEVLDTADVNGIPQRKLGYISVLNFDKVAKLCFSSFQSTGEVQGGGYAFYTVGIKNIYAPDGTTISSTIASGKKVYISDPKVSLTNVNQKDLVEIIGYESPTGSFTSYVGKVEVGYDNKVLSKLSDLTLNNQDFAEYIKENVHYHGLATTPITVYSNYACTTATAETIGNKQRFILIDSFQRPLTYDSFGEPTSYEVKAYIKFYNGSWKTGYIKINETNSVIQSYTETTCLGKTDETLIIKGSEFEIQYACNLYNLSESLVTTNGLSVGDKIYTDGTSGVNGDYLRIFGYKKAGVATLFDGYINTRITSGREVINSSVKLDTQDGSVGLISNNIILEPDEDPTWVDPNDWTLPENAPTEIIEEVV